MKKSHIFENCIKKMSFIDASFKIMIFFQDMYQVMFKDFIFVLVNLLLFIPIEFYTIDLMMHNLTAKKITVQFRSPVP